MPTKPKTFRPAGLPDAQENRRTFDKQREKSHPWRKWYRTKRWSVARIAFLSRNPRCVDCRKLFRVDQLEVDHDEPVREAFLQGGIKAAYELFWDVAKWRSRCKPCHSSKTAKGM